MTVPDTMQVARLHGWGDVRLEDAPVPEPGPGEAVVRVDACGVCGSDALAWYVERKAPAVLGHEPAGTVVRVGDGVSRVRAGDRVFVHHHAPCMDCPECRRRLWSNCPVWRASRLDPGGFAEYVRVPAANLEADTLLLPESMDLETATFIEPLACCIRAVRRQGRLEPGDSVLVVGLGGMGQLMVPLARRYGAARVLGSDFLAERRDRALRRGADAAFDPAAADVAAEVRRETGGRGADVVIVCPGSSAAVQAGLEAAAPGARVVCFTPMPPGEPLAVDLSALYFREVELVQSYSCGPDETREALALLSDGAVETASLVTHRADLGGVADALERAAGKGDGLKTVIYPGGVPARAPAAGQADRRAVAGFLSSCETTPGESAESSPLRRFDGAGWVSVATSPYKAAADGYAGVIRRLLAAPAAAGFDLRYFELEPGGYSSHERHRHVHVVMGFRGRGRVRLGNELHDIGFGDVVTVAPDQPHQFLNPFAEPFGFLCVVDRDRDRPRPVEG